MSDNQNEFPLPLPNDDKRSSVNLLPRFFRTEANKKFLQATLDQLIQPGVAEKLNGYYGRETSKAYMSGDSYIEDVSSSRKNYQLEPAAVIKDNLDNVTFYKDYNDYINQIKIFGGNTGNHSRLNSQESYPWNPNIDWDKFVNFREYYWLPNGPRPIPVRGQSKDVVSTYTVTLADDGDNQAYVFSPNGFTRNPSLKLYRGQKYRFEINTPGHPIAFAITRSFTPGNAVIVAGREGVRGPGLYDAELYGNEYDIGDFIILPSSGGVSFEDDDNVSTLYPDGIRKLGVAGEEIANVYVEKGTIEFTIPFNAPNRLFYISKNDINTSGLVKIYDIEENTFLDIENEIIGKKTYLSANGIQLSNGMKIYFQGDVVPEKYNEGEYYVEGVGDKIKLIRDRDLIIPAAYNTDLEVPFDTVGYDKLPFEDASAYASDKDYIVINRASLDRNPWSRYNRWFHRDIINLAATYNNEEVDVDESARAKRPIIEFEAGLWLYNYGTFAKIDVDLVDTFTTDVFSTIEGTLGYNVDGIDLAQGMRVLFTADTDILVRGKIYQVNFITIGNNRQISLLETTDTEPLENETVFITNGLKNAGQTYWFDGTEWKLAQEKKTRNQPPLFDLCCSQGNRFTDVDVFNSSTFVGTKLFSYKVGEGAPDSELGFALSYQNIENSGDIVFEFNLLTDSFLVQTENGIVSVSTNNANLRKYSDRTTFEWVNGWSKDPAISQQKVIRQFVATEIKNNNFEIDVYDKAGDLNDLKVVVYLNQKIQKEFTTYEIDRINAKALIRFYNNLNIDDVILIKTTSATIKNNNGWYEFPYNLERNPDNDDIAEFSLGEVIEHVDSMIEDIIGFEGVYPGPSNLRDLGNLDIFGKRFFKHSGPINLPLYHITNKNYNLVKAIEYSRREYARFKRNLIQIASTLGFEGIPRIHLDRILTELNKDKVKTQPFYFSDMLGYGPANRIVYTVLDPRNPFYAVTTPFNLESLSSRSINVYLDNVQLLYGRDYTFESSFVLVNAGQKEGQILEIIEYETTDGSYIPPTPSKLGLYPLYEPMLIIDDTYISSRSTISSTGPYKIYGEIEDPNSTRNKLRGWFYPIFTSKSAAQAVDSASQATQIKLAGLPDLIFIPTNSGNFGVQDELSIDEYPIGTAVIRGHDGSLTKAYKDYRDNLLLDFESRIFNNTKARYDSNLIDLLDFIPGKFRNTGFTKQEINSTILSDFSDWLRLVDKDYTANDFYDRNNEFTFNYSSMTSVVDGALLPGFWRSVYIEAFDTDRPHTHPWEILGFSNKPSWWNTVYGPSPYTSNNLILWDNIAEGKIAEPGNIRYNEKVARPGIRNFIPVDSQGKLINPIQSNYAKNLFFRNTVNNFVFGDIAPVENAWRRSSEYPYAIIKAWLLNQPAKAMALGFDTSRIVRNLVGQKIYKETYKHIKLADLVLPNTVEDDVRINTSGYVNFIYNLVASNILTVYDDYRSDLRNLTNQLGIKIGGFSDKTKFKLVLDARSPSQYQQGGVFVPEENYQIFLNTSSPVDIAVYSGVLVEKATDGFIIRGYDIDLPYFYYKNYLISGNDQTVTVGGISENFTDFAADKIYIKGQVIRQGNNFFRVTRNFTSSSILNSDNVVPIPELPIVGGKSAIFRKRFDTKNSRLAYGSKLKTIQEVVDFILGYGKYLEEIGFDFNYLNRDTQYVENWDHSAREFLFWTTQGWAAGTSISLSPSASELRFSTELAVVVDNIYDEFYNYGILKADGLPLVQKFNSLLRTENSFGIDVVESDDGIYQAKLPLVQKEHVVLIDNKTVFNDTIYQKSSGYRQERIKVLGYRSDNWKGGLNIPGFVFDDAKITEWKSWQDYQIGSLVKYKQFFYVALYSVPGSEDFVSSFWFRLNEKPESQLIANFDYRINQFADFYDLDSDNFDAEQQRLAQHLIGYQKREYLSNIINDDISQYKFYQGFIQDKGTRNSISKLFLPLSNSQTQSLELYEEWAIQVGRYGNTDNLQQVEFLLDEEKFKESPQAIELVNSLPTEKFDSVYRILPYEVYDKPNEYNHEPFPTTILKEYVISGGYVHEDDVDFKAGSLGELATSDVNQLSLGTYIWLTNNGNDDWGVYQLVQTPVNGTGLIAFDTATNIAFDIWELTVDKWTTNIFTAGDLIGIKDAQIYNLFGIYEISSVDFNKIYIKVPSDSKFVNFENELLPIILLRNVRVDILSSGNDIVQEKIYEKQKLWIDNYTDENNWAVLENTSLYSNLQTLPNPSDFDSTDHDFSKGMTATNDNRNLFVSAPGDNDGKVYYYKRTRESIGLQQELTLTPPLNLFTLDQCRFGESISVSEDGEFLVVGIPDARSVKTRFKNDFDPNITYNKNDIVRYRESLWKANRTILPTIVNQPYSTFDNYIRIDRDSVADSTLIRLLSTGNPNIENSDVGHFLVRAPLDQYLGSSAGYTLKLAWNTRSFAFPTLDTYLPFDGTIPLLSTNFITNEHVILAKIDRIFYIDTFVSLPEKGDVVENDTGSGTVYHIGIGIDDAVIYLTEVTGNFDLTGELYKVDQITNEQQFLGFYTEADTANFAEDVLGGWWYIGTGYNGSPSFPVDPQDGDIVTISSIDYVYDVSVLDSIGRWNTVYNNNGNWFDIGRGLVYVDLIPPAYGRATFNYYNIQNTIAAIGPYLTTNNQASFITHFSYAGNPGGIFDVYQSDLFAIRGPKEYTDLLSAGDDFEFRLYNLENRIIDLASKGFSYSILNKKQTVYDLWDGYIDFEFTEFDFSGFPFEPVVGDIVEDIQTPNGPFGGLSLTSFTTSSARVEYIERRFNNVRLYVKILSGDWDLLNNIGRYQLRRKANVAVRGPGDVDRTMGTVDNYDNQIVLGNSLIGKLIIIQADNNFAATSVQSITDEEYFFFDEEIIGGTARDANPPSSINKDYTQVFNIPADEFGTVNGDDSDYEGAVAIYRRLPSGLYRLQKVLSSEYTFGKNSNRIVNRRFGKQVKIIKNRNYYVLFVSSKGTGIRQNCGSIEIFIHGIKDDALYAGEWTIRNDYTRNQVVKYRSEYYRALKDISSVGQTENSILDTTKWLNISWSQGKDPKWRGDWNNEEGYGVGAIVVYNEKLYKANTNIREDIPFNTSDWTELNNTIDYLGYLPNLTGFAYFSEDVFDPAENIVEFAKRFDVSADGNILITVSEQEETDSTTTTIQLLVYRLVGDKYQLSEKFFASDNISGFAQNISINPTGNLFAVTEPFNDSDKNNEGVVYVYAQTNGSFNLLQILESPNDEAAEQFGFNAYFGKDNLVVSSLNGDMTIPTSFDTFERKLSTGLETYSSVYVNDPTSNLKEAKTTFDKGFTTFNRKILDTGMVYVYEEINDQLLFAESFRYDNATSLFGQNLLSIDNHVYIGMPRFGNNFYQGTVIDYRKQKNQQSWNLKRQLIEPVDVDKIAGAFLYDRQKNQILSYIDYIDPIQGKIAGPAEQEISYKVGYDPAVYNNGRYDFVDIDNFWAEEHVGKVWWNIKKSRFTYPYQGDIQYQKNNWNELQPESTVEIYEWVESNVSPREWDSITDTEQGLSQGISGVSVYGDLLYSSRLTYDNVSNTFGTKYFFWVKNKRTVPQIEGRSLSIVDVAALIAAPRENGYRFISFLSKNRFVLNNCESLIYNDNVVLNIRYYKNKNNLQNIHTAYQIISDGLETSPIHPDIERKWFDSLIGFDEQRRPVPNPAIPVRQQIGIQNRPRQSMFVNKTEALKQYIERVNSVLIKNIVVDNYDISPLFLKEEIPTSTTGLFDISIDTFEEIRFVSTSKIEQAILNPVIVNGKIVRVDIVNPGRGYKVAPTYTLAGNGTDAEFEFVINNLGQITRVDIVNTGKDYSANTSIFVRRFTVLVRSDINVANKWVLYSYNKTNRIWERISVQDFDVSICWDYADWYAEGFNKFSTATYLIDAAYELTSLQDRIGDIIKINNIGSGGWLLLQKIDSQPSEDYTVNYKTIGRQRGTIQFKDILYNFDKNTAGYDTRSFDSSFYDTDLSKELRIIFETIRDNLFVSNLKIEYNQLFFASLRYILSEQNYVDWMFKTSFVKIKHNVGSLYQDRTFNNDSLPSYQDYVEEVKPYKTVIREFVSAYNSLENTNTAVTDFDLAPSYDENFKSITPSQAVVKNNIVLTLKDNVNEYPRKYWLDNNGYQIKEIKIGDPGSGYTFKPVIRIVGGGGTGATAEAYLGYGRITSIKITNPGKGYISAPQVIIEGPLEETGTPANATAVLGNGLVRSPKIQIKFDRINKQYYFSTLAHTQSFVGTGDKVRFDLEWPMDVRPSTVLVKVDNEEKLRSEFSFENIITERSTFVLSRDFSYNGSQSAAGPGIQKGTNDYTIKRGRIVFSKPPANGANIVVTYSKDISLLSAEDRIQFFYTPMANMFGKDLSQLMNGIDYGGVEIRSFDFTGISGWDTQGWIDNPWDEFDTNYEDEVFIFDGSTLAIELSKPLEDGVEYNFYFRQSSIISPNPNPYVRIDDPNFGTPQQTNQNAILPSLIGDGSTTILVLDDYGIRVNDGDNLIVRKISSDGSFIPDVDSYDVNLQGGTLDYGNAKGIRAEEIIVDGDNFVTPTTSGETEELVPGQILDTLDIKVYTRDSGGQGQIFNQNYIMDSTVDTYDLGVIPSSKAAVFVKLNGVKLNDNEYIVDWINNTVKILNPVNNVPLSILTISQSNINILDYGSFITDGSTEIYETIVPYQEGISGHVTIDGIKQTVELTQTTSGYVGLFFNEIPANDKVLYYTIYSDNLFVNYSQVTKEEFNLDGITTTFTLSEQPFYEIPKIYNVLVFVNQQLLNAGYNVKYIIDSSRGREYAIENWQRNLLTTDPNKIKVYVAGTEIFAPAQFTFSLDNNGIILADGIGNVNDEVQISIIDDGDYNLEGNNIVIYNTYNNGDKLKIYKFSNHDLLNIERINYEVVNRSTIPLTQVDLRTFNRLTVGEITLRNPAIDAQYVWVVKNRTLLSPSVDYYVTDDRLKVRLLNPPVEDDIIEVIHLSSEQNVPKFAFRQFKDILNRTHYKRIDSPVTILAQDLNQYDLRIELVNGNNLPEPDRSRNIPGVIFIEGERIEYFIKENNTLRQIRRGTLGTGVKSVYSLGTDVYDQNVNKTIPYKDITETQTIIADGVSNVFLLGFSASSVNEFEVFVAGKRLRKNAVSIFNKNIALKSPEGDQVSPAEFTFNQSTNQITLAQTPALDSKIIIVRKIGRLWTELGTPLHSTDNDIANFLRAGTTTLPK